jgi:hypothetical protein
MDNPTNNEQNITYKMTYTGESSVPKDGFIKVDFPTDVIF